MASTKFMGFWDQGSPYQFIGILLCHVTP